MTFHCDWFLELYLCENEYVSLGDGPKYKVMGRGRICIRRTWNASWMERWLDMFFILSLNKNLFSIEACINRNYKITFRRNRVEFYINNVLKTQGIKQDNNLVHKLIRILHSNDANLVSNLKQWHERLDHINHTYIRQLRQEDLIKRTKIDD